MKGTIKKICRLHDSSLAPHYILTIEGEDGFIHTAHLRVGASVWFSSTNERFRQVVKINKFEQEDLARGRVVSDWEGVE